MRTEGWVDASTKRISNNAVNRSVTSASGEIPFRCSRSIQIAVAASRG